MRQPRADVVSSQSPVWCQARSIRCPAAALRRAARSHAQTVSKPFPRCAKLRLATKSRVSCKDRPAMTEPLLRVKNLVKHFLVKRGIFPRAAEHVHAVNDVSFEIGAGETLGLVGESGCGKSTTGRCILRLIEPTSGEVWFEGTNVTALNRTELRALCRDMQIIFQDPYALRLPSGCPFHSRCPIRQLPLCADEPPLLKQSGNGHWVACHLRG